LIRAWFEFGTGFRLDFREIPILNVFYIFVSFFIVLLTLISLVNRGAQQTSAFGVFLFFSFLIYGISDTRYEYLNAAGFDAESDFFNAVFLLSIVLLAVAFSKVSVSKFMQPNAEKFQVKREDVIGLTFTVVGLVTSAVMYAFGMLKESDLAILLVAGLAYFLISKTMLANDLNKQLIAKAEEEKEQLQEQVSFQQQELYNANEQLEQATYLDSLTGLHNRSYWNIYQNDVLLANPDIHFVLFALDINYFKLMNDTYGHSGADLILREYGQRLASLQNDYIQAFRIGGDQFMISCVDLDGLFDRERFAQKLQDLLDRPFEVDDKVVHLNSSVGGAVYPDDTDDMERLLLYADYAKNSVKHSSNLTTCAFYQENTMPLMQRKLLLEKKLQDVDYDQEFSMMYQPQVDAKTGRLLGMEALVRWMDPELGMILPEEFVPVAEEMGIMSHMGEWILAESLHQISEWNHKFEKELVMGINISPLQLCDENFADDFFNMLEATENKPEWVDLEITEGVALNANATNKVTIDKLRSGKVSISVDDFGTGYGTFMNMLQFHFDRIKIAEELVMKLTSSEPARVIVSVIVGMARGLHLTTIAEGVENEETLDILSELGCDQIQGFYSGEPVSAQQFEEHWF
jgi:diguanylate cyclase (GGDEF)-like protein